MRRLASASLLALLACCASRRPSEPPPREPPPRVLAVGLDTVSLRANAYVDLHAWLATTPGPQGLDAAAEAYRNALAEDDRDELFARTLSSLSACATDRCAKTALASTAFSKPFGDTLATYVARDWTDRAATARAAIEIARAALGPESDALLHRAARDLAIDLPAEPIAVDVVVDAPSPKRDALVPVALAVHGACFAKSDGVERVQDARIIDCVLYRALRAQRTRSRLGIALERELGLEKGARAWDVVVIHAVAAIVTSWEPKHQSPLRRSANAVEPKLLAWLAEHWPEEPAELAWHIARIER